MAARGPKNGCRVLERGVPLVFWALLSAFASQSPERRPTRTLHFRANWNIYTCAFVQLLVLSWLLIPWLSLVTWGNNTCLEQDIIYINKVDLNCVKTC